MATVSQEELDRRLAAAGGSRLVHSGTVGKRKVPNPSYDKYDPSSTETVELDVQQWKSPEGHTIQAVQMPDGSWEVTQDEPPAPKPPTTANNPASAVTGATVQIEGTPDPSKPGGFDNERPVKVTRDAQGRQVGLAVPLAGKELQDWYEDRERSRNPGRKTDQQIADEKAKADAEAARNAPKPEKDGNGQWGYWDTKQNPPRWVPIAGGPASEGSKPVEVNGVMGVWRPGATPNDPPTFVPANVPAQSAGPSMPEIVLGQSQAALRTYKGQLQAEVASGRKTQAWADARWAEALQVANVAVQEANTLQRERESNLNAQVNLATTKYNNQAKGLNDALTFVNEINGKLPPGSDLGGKAFAAMLGLQMLQAKESGIYDIKPTDPNANRLGQAATAATATTTAEIGRLTQPPAAAPAAPAGTPGATPPAAAPAPPPPAATGPNPATPNLVPPPPTSATPPATPPPSSVVPAGTPNPGPVPGQDPNVWTPPPAAGTVPTAPNPPMPEDQGDGGRTPIPAQSAAPADPDPMITRRKGSTVQTMRKSEWEQKARINSFYAYGWEDEPDATTVSTPPQEPPQSQMAPQTDFAALQAYQPAGAQSDMGQQPAAVLAAEAASIPPWRMTEEQYNRYRAAGVPDEVILSPGRVAA